MRVIAGSAGRLELQVPRGADIRPTQDKVRGAIFSILGERTPDARVLDLFAGTGALGIEALSRGAASATLVEKHRACLACLHANLAHTHLESVARVVALDVSRFLAGDTGTYDLVFADPPYEKRRGTPPDTAFFDALAARLAPGGVFVFEFHAPNPPPAPAPFSIASERRYGETGVWFLRHP
jgi:16S rRNA (guanine966-N2)-methyltransferase